MVLSQAIVADVVPARQRGRYMGVMGAVFGLSSVLGPLLGGFFTEGPGWRWALWFNLPVCLLALVVAVAFLHLPRRGAGRRTDWAGTILMATGTTALILLSSWGGHRYEWTDPVIFALGALFLVCALAFVLVELRAADPLIPMALFRQRNFTLSTAAGLIIGVAMFGCIAYLPTYIQMVHGLSPTAAGLMMTPMMAVMGTSIVVGNIVNRTGRYKCPVVGSIVMAVGLWLIGSCAPRHTPAPRCGPVRVRVRARPVHATAGAHRAELVPHHHGRHRHRVQQLLPPDRRRWAPRSWERCSSAGSPTSWVSASPPRPGAGPEGAEVAAGFANGSGAANSVGPEILMGCPDRYDAIVGAYTTPWSIYHVVVPLILVATVMLVFLREDTLKETID